MHKPWEDTYIDIVVQGFLHSDMPSSNHVWDAYLRDNGFDRHIIPNFCPDCYTVRQFCYDHPKGTYILATGTASERDGHHEQVQVKKRGGGISAPSLRERS